MQLVRVYLMYVSQSYNHMSKISLNPSLIVSTIALNQSCCSTKKDRRVSFILSVQVVYVYCTECWVLCMSFAFVSSAYVSGCLWKYVSLTQTLLPHALISEEAIQLQHIRVSCLHVSCLHGYMPECLHGFMRLQNSAGDNLICPELSNFGFGYLINQHLDGALRV